MLRLTVIAHPGARDERVVLDSEGTLHVYVSAPAVDGKANAAIERSIAERLDLRPHQVRLIRGATARRKLIEIEASDGAMVEQRLVAHGMRSR